MRDEVQALLLAHEEAGLLLQEGPAGTAGRSLAAGARLGPYEIVAPLGTGGMGAVYRARDLRLGREVAVKVVARDALGGAGAALRLEREARAAAALNHPNIVAVYDVGIADGLSYIVSELLEGETLRDALRRGPLAWRRALELGAQAAAGLAAAHERGIVHRDLKPENLFLLARDGRLKLLDFGLAQHLSSWPGRGPAALTVPGAILGTVGYMSPEQARGQSADARSDVFSFGAVLYEMLAGERAFSGASAVETLNAILVHEPSRPLRAPAAVAQLLRRCLRKDSAERFASGRELLSALEAALSGPETDAPQDADESERAARLRLAALDPRDRSGAAELGLTPSARDAGSGRHTGDVEAHQLYLQGLHFWNKRHAGGLQHAARCFEKAIERDPAYALAHAGLADTYAVMGLAQYDLQPAREAMPRAQAEARRALELDPGLAAPHAALGWALFLHDWDWAGAEASFLRALELDPRRATTRQWYGFLLSATGRFEAAEAEARLAVELEPQSLIVNTQPCQAAYYARRYEDVVRQAHHVIRMEPSFPVSHAWLGLAYAAQDRCADAVAAFAAFGASGGAQVATLALLGNAHARTGDAGEARRRLDELDALARSRPVSAHAYALVHVGLGELDAALAWLEKALAERSDQAAFLGVEPMLDPLRGDPRFAALLERLALPATAPPPSERRPPPAQGRPQGGVRAVDPALRRLQHAFHQVRLLGAVSAAIGAWIALLAPAELWATGLMLGAVWGSSLLGLLYQARQVRRERLTHDDVAAAFDADARLLGPEARGGPEPTLLYGLTGGAGLLGMASLLSAVALRWSEVGGPSWHVALAAFGMLLLARGVPAAFGSPQRARTWSRLWRGPLGRACLALAEAGLRREAQAAPPSRAPTRTRPPA